MVCACLTVNVPSILVIYLRNERNQQTVGGDLVYVRSSLNALFSLVAYFVRADNQWTARPICVSSLSLLSTGNTHS